MNLRTIVALATVLLPTLAFAQAPGENDQIKQMAQSGIELMKRTPTTGPVEAQILLNVNSLLSAVAGGQLVVSRPAPPVVPGLQGAPAPTPKEEGK